MMKTCALCGTRYAETTCPACGGCDVLPSAQGSEEVTSPVTEDSSDSTTTPARPKREKK